MWPFRSPRWALVMRSSPGNIDWDCVCACAHNNIACRDSERIALTKIHIIINSTHPDLLTEINDQNFNMSCPFVSQQRPRRRRHPARRRLGRVGAECAPRGGRRDGQHVRHRVRGAQVLRAGAHQYHAGRHAVHRALFAATRHSASSRTAVVSIAEIIVCSTKHTFIYLRYSINNPQ